MTLESGGVAALNKGRVLDVYTNRWDGFTDGYIAQFRNATSAKMYIRGDGNVGIGTTTPSASLEVKRTTADTNYAAWIEGTQTTNFGLGVNIANVGSTIGIANFKSNNISRMYIRADGNVWIGTTSPLTNLHLRSGGDVWGLIMDPFTSALVEENTGWGARMELASTESGNNASQIFLTNVNGATNNKWTMGQSADLVGGYFGIGYSTSTTNAGIYGNEDFVITKTGNVWIGTTNPNFSLQFGTTTGGATPTPKTIDMGGTYSNAAATNLKFRIYNNGSTQSGLWISAGQMEYVSGVATIDHVFYSTATNEIMRLKASNNYVWIGTTNPGDKLDVRSGIYAPNQNLGIQIGIPTGQWVSSFRIKSDGTGNARTAINSTDGTANGTTRESISIGASGNVGIGTISPAASLEVKRTIVDSNYAAWIEGTQTTNHGLGVNVASTGSTIGIANFKSDNTSRMYIRADGNVGIGTISPIYSLDIRKNDGQTNGEHTLLNLSRMTPNTNIGGLYLGYLSDGTSDIGGWVRSIGNLPLILGTAPSNQAMTIAINGNVGIGTTGNPTSKLQVVGLPVYANNAAATASGLTVGAFYRTGADPDPVMVVH